MIIAMIAGLAAGVIIGYAFNITYPTVYSFYITMGLLAAFDSMLGAVRAHLDGKYSNLIFISGFITNAIMAALLVFLGDKLGVPLYYAAIFIFGGRLFQNLAVIRRLVIDKYLAKKKGNMDEK